MKISARKIILHDTRTTLNTRESYKYEIKAQQIGQLQKGKGKEK